jgi:hypothetical protein
MDRAPGVSNQEKKLTGSLLESNFTVPFAASIFLHSRG